MLPNALTTMATVFVFSFCWQWTDTTYSSLYFNEMPVLANVVDTMYIRVGLNPDPLATGILRNAAAIIIMLPLMVLFVFAILLTHKPGDKAEPLTSQKKALGLTAAVLGVAACSYALVSFAVNACGSAADSLELDMARLGQMLMGTEKYQYLLPFEAISVLLLACIIGGIVVARKK